MAYLCMHMNFNSKKKEEEAKANPVNTIFLVSIAFISWFYINVMKGKNLCTAQDISKSIEPHMRVPVYLVDTKKKKKFMYGMKQLASVIHYYYYYYSYNYCYCFSIYESLLWNVFWPIHWQQICILIHYFPNGRRKKK